MAADPRVLADPFFGVVARRHPDATIVLLPPEAAESADEDASSELLTEPDFRARSAADLAAVDEWLGSVLAGREVAQESDEGWAPVAPDAVSRRRLFSVSDLSLSDASAILQTGIETLTAQGWQVVEEQDGMPRFRARRDTVTVKLMYVVSTGRLAIVTTAGPYPLEPDFRDVLLEGEARG
ncbi:hypothetical protein BJ980_001567 [Nocardioides daedukensis]|uniref:Uncharacterized protein n=1 Tax=Nocardioides daedukensis TaxID=634462 RepID=A0A7Y9S2Q9_9ACTN|nr:hypothetical protein [Nocardioides daedukensis]NYG58644.1 hypothetical protein [Nocardioides daedukensis]